MNQTPLPWALLVVGQPTKHSAQGSRTVGSRTAGSRPALDSPATVLSRALSLTSIAKTSCLIGDDLRDEWSAVTRQLWTANVFSLLPDERVVNGVVRTLETLRAQEPEATVILIPYNHCAVEEVTWLESGQGALRLASAHRNTVYLLHDKPENDPRIALEKPEICSSSVLLGSVGSLIALCVGSLQTMVVDLVVEKPSAEDIAAFTDRSDDPHAPLNLVHVRLVEEYVRLQRAEVWHRRSRQIDLHA